MAIYEDKNWMVHECNIDYKEFKAPARPNPVKMNYDDEIRLKFSSKETRGLADDYWIIFKLNKKKTKIIKTFFMEVELYAGAYDNLGDYVVIDHLRMVSDEVFEKVTEIVRDKYNLEMIENGD